MGRGLGCVAQPTELVLRYKSVTHFYGCMPSEHSLRLLAPLRSLQHLDREAVVRKAACREECVNLVDMQLRTGAFIFGACHPPLAPARAPPPPGSFWEPLLESINTVL